MYLSLTPHLIELRLSLIFMNGDVCMQVSYVKQDGAIIKWFHCFWAA